MQRKASTPEEADAAPFLLERFLPYELSIAANRASRLFARQYSAAFGLSIPEWRVMAVVGRFGAVAPSAIAERTEMDRVKVSRAVASLVRRGLAGQAVDPEDGRARLVTLSEQGQQTHRAIVALARELDRRLAAGLSAAEREALHAALRKLYAHLRALDAADAVKDAGTKEELARRRARR